MWRALAIVALCVGEASAAELSEDLYRAETIVTGVEAQERQRGFREGLEEIIVKLTGRPSLKGQPAIAPILDDAGAYVASHSYEDRMKHLPIHDEQGTRDRPHFLRITADRGKLEAALASRGIAVWRGSRPRVGLLIGVTDARGFWRVPSEGSRGYEQREVLKSAARRLGIAIVFPHAEGLDALDTVMRKMDEQGASMPADEAMLAEVRKTAWGGEPPQLALAGSLVLLPSGYWTFRASLQLHPGTGCKLAEMNGVTFDRALGHALAQLVEFLSMAATAGSAPFKPTGPKGFCLVPAAN